MSTRVLVIEDNDQNLYLVRFLLQRRDCEISAAREGRRGVEMAEQEPPDLILLDIQLPDLDGYAVARMLRSIDSLKRVPIVAVTSYAMVGDREKVMESGCTGYIEKPIDPETFGDQVLEFVGRSDPGRSDR